MSTVRYANWAACLNLLVPGAGIILLGRIGLGLLSGLLFVLCANYALWATLLVPDDFPAWAQGLGIGLGAGTYLGAQLRLAQTVRDQARQQQATIRRKALLAVSEQLTREDFPAALAALAPLRDFARNDLLIAYRLAQVYTGMQDVDAARTAWQLVRTLDRHGVYRAQAHAAERSLALPPHPGGSAPTRTTGPI